jgi:hypothetical protein
MARFETDLSESPRQFIAARHGFFNAPAPGNGRIESSPKRRYNLRILNNLCVAYPLAGSKNGAAAHVAENGRLTLTFLV